MVERRGAAVPAPPREVRAALAPLVRDPGTTAIVTDFDGTLSPIVDDPAGAQPVEGAVDVLVRLAHRFGVVAVVSGRPVAFLSEVLLPGGPTSGAGSTTDLGDGGVRLVGLYGLEWWQGDTIALQPGAEPWRPVVADAARRLSAGAPSGISVERKGLAVTVHWRRAPDAASWAASAVRREEERTGLVAHPGRRSLELRPPLEVDKGTVLRRLVAGCTAACYFGDDLGDLPAYATLAALGREKGMDTLAVAVVDDESAAEVVAAADLVLPGPVAAMAALEWLVGAAGPSGNG
ncbi:MAG: trehalose-phosphatase [Acidimicrobiales bacterium]